MRKTHHNVLIVLALIFLSHIATAQSKDYETYQATEFTIKYPADWRVDETGIMGTKVIFFSPLESADDKFSENINILVQDLTEHPMTLKEYTDLSVEQIKTLATNGKVIESKTIKTANGEMQRLIYTADQGQYHLQFDQLYLIVKGKAYLVTYTAEVDKYQQYLSKANEALGSFILNK